jgi:hypothetical protein
MINNVFFFFSVKFVFKIGYQKNIFNIFPTTRYFRSKLFSDTPICHVQMVPRSKPSLIQGHMHIFAGYIQCIDIIQHSQFLLVQLKPKIGRWNSKFAWSNPIFCWLDSTFCYNWWQFRSVPKQPRIQAAHDTVNPGDAARYLRPVTWSIIE